MKKPTERKTISDIIQDQIEYSIMQQKTPEKVTIIEVGKKNKCTIKTSIDDVTIKNVKCIGGNIKAKAIGILFYLDNDEMIVIT